MFTMRRNLFLGLILALVGASGLTAQMGRMRQGGMQRGGPLHMMPRLQAYAPDLVLEKSDELSLTENQIDELQAIARDLNETVRESQATHDEQRRQLQAAVQTTVLDPEEVSTHFWTAHAAMGRLHWAQVEASLKTFEVLSDTQRKIIESS